MQTLRTMTYVLALALLTGCPDPQDVAGSAAQALAGAQGDPEHEILTARNRALDREHGTAR